MVYECCAAQSLSEKCGLASPSGLVPSCRVPQAQAAVKKQPPGPHCRVGWCRCDFLGTRNRSQHAYLMFHLWLGRFGWCLESMWKPQVKFLLYMLLPLVIFQRLHMVIHFTPEHQDMFSAQPLESTFIGFVWSMLLLYETRAAKWILDPAHYEMKELQTKCFQNVSKGDCCWWFLALVANTKYQE